MSQRPDADLIIIGGGCAGLSLASRLARSRSGLSVLIIEPRDHYKDDRSWCFWRPERHDLSHLVSARWPGWSFSRRGEVPTVQTLNRASYQYVRSTDFYDHARAAISDAPKISLQMGLRADDLVPTHAGVLVKTPNGELVGRYVIDTRPPTARASRLATLFQCFASYELSLPGGHGLDLATAELMTDMESDRLGFRFSYVLPMHHDRLLVESTRFSFDPVSREQLQDDLDELVENRGWDGASIQRREFGVLPMGLPREKAPGIQSVYRAGIGSGGLRAASGYGFLRIQDWADVCAHRLLSGQTPIHHPDTPVYRQYLNQIFFRALKAEPERAPDFFMALVHKMNSDQMVRFMSDQTRLTDLITIMTRLPPAPFVRAALSGKPQARSLLQT